MSFGSPEVVFPEHFGFCGGVAAADKLVENVAIEAAARDIAVFGLHEIVHNKDVVRKHEASGVTFVNEVAEIPEGSAVVISAHGAGPEVVHALKEKGCEPFDATCPLVIHTHKGVEHARQNDEKVIYVCHGKPGEVEELHDEVAGLVGHLDFRMTEDGELIRDPIARAYLELNEVPTDEGLLSESGKYRIITQTTLHADDCLRYREEIKGYILSMQPDAQVSWSSRGDVCRAVADRQAGVEQLVELKPRRIVVATDPGSKNGMGYVKLAQELVAAQGQDTEVHAVANAAQARELPPVEGITGVTASASTPIETITAIAQELGYESTPEISDGTFNLPDAKPDNLRKKLGNLITQAQGADA